MCGHSYDGPDFKASNIQPYRKKETKISCH